MKRCFKNLSLLLVVALLVSFCMPAGFARAEDAETVSITILHTNDIHGRVMEGSYDGMGLAKLASKVNEMREANENVLLLDAGDTLHGQPIVTISRGESMVEILNTMKYDAMTPGNHDFNYGQDRLVELAEMADFPILSANVVKENGSTLLEPYIIKEIGGIRVGIFGLSTPETTYKTNPKNVEGLTFKDPIDIAEEMVDELDGRCDIIVALAHIGLDEASEFTSEKIAQEVEGIDLIVDGHSHSTLPEGKKVNDTLIVQTGEYDKSLGVVNVSFQNGELAEISASLFTKDQAAELEEDEDVKAVIDGIIAENEEVTSVVVGSTDVKLDGERENVRTGETNMGNTITNAMLKVTGADAAITNGGGIRASIEPGEITKGDIITVLPFGNYVVLKEVKGSDILAALEHGISAYPEQMGAFPHVAGITFSFDPHGVAGKKVKEVKIGGEALVADKVYKLATNDFMAAGGDEYVMLKDGEILGEYPGLDDIVIEYIQEYGTEGTAVEGRVTVSQASFYVVQKGDVLWRIAKKFGLVWKTLAEYNKLVNPHLIFPGQKIYIPAN